MKRPFKEGFLVRFPPCPTTFPLRKTEVQTGKITKSKSVAKQEHKLWAVVW